MGCKIIVKFYREMSFRLGFSDWIGFRELEDKVVIFFMGKRTIEGSGVGVS